jgi:phosphoglycolate phosphatase-like HAD superfamily hydrolase
MKTIYLDFNGTLETGSELSLTRAVNEIFREMGIKKRYTPEEMLRNFGKPLAEIIRSDIPEDIDMRDAIERIRKKDLSHMEKYIKPAYGSEETIKEISENGDRLIILSLTNRTLLNAFLEKHNLNHYVGSIVWEDLERQDEELKRFLAKTSVHDFGGSEKFYQFLVGYLKQAPTEEDFKSYSLCCGARSQDSDLTVMVGDAKEDMLACQKANELLTREYDYLEKKYGIVKHRKSIIGVLLDPDGNKSIPCNYRIRELPEILRIFY